METGIIVAIVSLILSVWGFRVSGDKQNTASARWLGTLVGVAALVMTLITIYPLVRPIFPFI